MADLNIAQIMRTGIEWLTDEEERVLGFKDHAQRYALTRIRRMTAAQFAGYTGSEEELVELTDVVGHPQFRWDGTQWIQRAGRGWKDLIGDVVPKTTGVGSPTLTVFRDQVRWFAYAANEDGDTTYHMPHDWAPGTDLFLHCHWAHNGTNISGSFVLTVYLTFARGFQQGATSEFLAQVTRTITVSDLNITNTPRYQHRVDEIQISAAGGAGGLLDTDRLEVDGLLLVHYDVATIPTITGGAAKPFIFTLDLHYQADRDTTPGKAPSFYAV